MYKAGLSLRVLCWREVNDRVCDGFLKAMRQEAGVWTVPSVGDPGGVGDWPWSA